MIRIGTHVEAAKLTGPPKASTSAHFAVLKREITLATARNAPRKDRHKVKPAGAPSSKLKRYRVGKYAAIGAPILSLMCYVYILMHGYAMNLPPRQAFMGE